MGFESDIIQCDRVTGLEGSFHDFIKLAWDHVYPGSPFQDNWHIGCIAEHYEACFRGEIRELVVNVPPGGSKSSITCVMFPVWGWLQRPPDSWIFGAYGQKLVRRDAYASIKLMKSEWFQARWGDRFRLPTTPAVDLFYNDKTGFRLATTPGGEVTGHHANFQVIDDPNKPEELSKVQLEKVIEWEARTMSTRWRRPPQLNSLILIMQRLHCNDLASALIDRGATHLCFPAEFKPHRRTITTWGRDPRTAPGELLDPVRLPKELIKKLRRDLGGTNAAAQLDQDPVPEGGAVFKRIHLKYWGDMPPQIDQVILSVDCAFKDEEGSDFVCIQVWGRVGGQFYLLDQEHDHLDFPGTTTAVIRMAKKWPQATVKLIEDKANGSAVIQTLTGKVPGMIAVTPEGGKLSRAAGCSGLFEAGDVFIPDPKLPGYEWVDTVYVPELLNFPRGKNDDQVDSTTQALIYLQANTSWLKAAMDKVRSMALGRRYDTGT